MHTDEVAVLPAKEYAPAPLVGYDTAQTPGDLNHPLTQIIKWYK